MKLDKKYMQIIYEMSNNPKINLKKLAKQINLSKEGTFARIKRLEETKVITGYVTNIDLEKIGYVTYSMYLKFPSASKKEVGIILDFLKKLEQSTVILTCNQEYDAFCIIKVKNKQELKEIIQDIRTRFKESVNISKVITPLFSEFYTREYLNTEKNCKIIEKTFKKDYRLNDNENQILKIISNNPKISSLQISKQINLSPNTVIKIIKELESKKIILGYTSIIDLKKIGIQIFKIEIKLTDINKINSLIEFCRKCPNINYITQYLDEFDAEIKIECENKEEFELILNQIKEVVNYKIEKIHVFDEKELIKVKNY